LALIFLLLGSSSAFPEPSLGLIALGDSDQDQANTKLTALVDLLKTTVPKLENAIKSGKKDDLIKEDGTILEWDIPELDITQQDSACPTIGEKIDDKFLGLVRSALVLLERGTDAFQKAKDETLALVPSTDEITKEIAALKEIIKDSEFTKADCATIDGLYPFEPKFLEMAASSGNVFGLRFNTKLQTKLQTKVKNPFKWLYFRVVDLIFSIPRLWAAPGTDALLHAHDLTWFTAHYRTAFRGARNRGAGAVGPAGGGAACIATPNIANARLVAITVNAAISFIVSDYYAPAYWYNADVEVGNVYPVNYLPWHESHCTFMMINNAIPRFISSEVSGCHIYWATNGANPPLAMHCNANDIKAVRLAAGDTNAVATVAANTQKTNDANAILALHPGYAITQTLVGADYNVGQHKAFIWGELSGGAWHIYAHHFYPRLIGHPQNTAAH